jgi:hypothetical protein
MKYIAVLFAFLGVAFSAHAQSTGSAPSEPWKNITLGPLFSAGAAVDAGTVAKGSKTNYAFAFSAGADVDFPVTPNFAANLALAYDARSINFHDQNTDANKVDYTFGYFEIRPELRFSGFMIGLGIGVPVSASATGGGTVTSPAIGSSAMNTLFEVRLGGMIPVVESNTGSLDFTIEGSYAFTKIVSTGAPLAFSGTSTSTSDNNGPLASVQLGVKYLFDLTNY